MTQDPKGTRDHPPRKARAKETIRQTIRRHAQRHGFRPLQTPIIENRDILTSKFTGGEEILKEMYTLTDQGERSLGLRYDLTVPFARFVSEHPELKFPFKRYQNGPVFRDGPVKPGRYREFEQFDLDIIGDTSNASDAELISIVYKVLRDLGLNPEIQVNTREFLYGVIDHVGKERGRADGVVLTIDKYEKKGREGVIEELVEKGVPPETATELLDTLNVEGNNKDLIETFSDITDTERLNDLHRYLEAQRVEYTFNPYLARGLTYYTGTIFEAFAPQTSFTSSIAAGGRYDDMIGNLSKNQSPCAVGASFGVDTLLDATTGDENPNKDAVYVAPLTSLEHVYPVCRELREVVDVTLGTPSKGFRKHLDYADKEGYTYLVVYGDNEVENDAFEVKNLRTGETRKGDIETIKDALHETF